MQNWKIKRMSFKQIHAWIIAINKVLAYYEGKSKPFVNCPLCTAKNAFRNNSSCDSCLWKILENKYCADFKEEIFSTWKSVRSVWMRARKQKRWKVLRIPMLKNWKKILKAELARREV